jgi:hypothetical protein
MYALDAGEPNQWPTVKPAKHVGISIPYQRTGRPKLRLFLIWDSASISLIARRLQENGTAKTFRCNKRSD